MTLAINLEPLTCKTVVSVHKLKKMLANDCGASFWMESIEAETTKRSFKARDFYTKLCGN